MHGPLEHSAGVLWAPWPQRPRMLRALSRGCESSPTTIPPLRSTDVALALKTLSAPQWATRLRCLQPGSRFDVPRIRQPPELEKRSHGAIACVMGRLNG